MAKANTFAFGFAAIHLVFCGVVGALVVGIEVLWSMPSGGYQPIALIFGALDKLILLLEAPVAVVLWLLYHPTARFQPPSLSLIDFVDSAPFLAVASLCVLWSIILGYLVAYGLRCFRK